MVVNGSISGPVSVASGGFLRLNGSVSGDLVIEAGAEVAFHGSVSGEIRNRGRLDVYGRVSAGSSTRAAKRRCTEARRYSPPGSVRRHLYFVCPRYLCAGCYEVEIAT